MTFETNSLLMKRTFVLAAIILAALLNALPALAQWSLDCSTISTFTTGTQGVWQMGSAANPQYCYSAVDSLHLKVFTTPCAQTATYTYTMNTAERSAYTRYAYPTSVDFTGDGINEIILLSYTLSGSVLRSALKIFDITTGTVLLERRDANLSFTCYPYNIADVNNDGILECVVIAANSAAGTQCSEIYSTGVAASGVSPRGAASPSFELSQNYPNPFNPSTRIEYSIAAPGNVSIDIFNVNGQKVTSLVNRYQTLGAHAVEWNSTDLHGAPVASGSYLYQVSIDGKPSDARKMILLR